MAQKMTDGQWRDFVSSGTRTGKLATVRADGSPHLAPLWFVLDGDDVVFNTGKDSVKGRNLARDGRFSLCVDDDRPPFAFVTLRGRVQISEDPDELHRWAGLIGARYMGADRAEELANLNGVPGELLLRGRIEKVIALTGLAE
jgi:PPOX class probable F420-dependent enzyme